MIELQNVNKIYTTKKGQVLHALKDINLSVGAGEIVGVIGRSGAGKSTLVRCVNLLERPTNGSVCVNNTELMSLNPSQLREARHNIGMVFQHFNLLSTATAFENVALPLKLIGKSKTEIKKTVIPLLDTVGLGGHVHVYPHHLSGGQKQRVAIARALATKPKVLLCDEMTSALDPETTDDILALVRKLNQEYQLSIMCITHEMSVVKSIADRVAVIEDGKIIECDTVTEIFKNPKTAVAKRFTQSILKSELPAAFQKKLQQAPIQNGNVVLRLTFVGNATLEPIINQLIARSDANVNILQANIENLREETIGQMIVSAHLGAMNLEKITGFLREKGLLVEVMGYAHG